MNATGVARRRVPSELAHRCHDVCGRTCDGWDDQAADHNRTALPSQIHRFLGCPARRAENRAVIGINPEGDKLTRAAKTSAQFEAGAVFFPKTAPWLSGLKAELLGFPNVRYDDQVDSVTQALAWIERRKQSYVPTVCPVIVRVHNPYRDAFPDYRDVPR
jgi:hypothetical protein